MLPKSLIRSKQQSLYSQSSATKKPALNPVKTPALLFYKPSQSSASKSKRQDQNEGAYLINSRSQPSVLSRQGSAPIFEYPCQNHPNIVAKFFSRTEEDDQQIFYCQKCATLLAEQGFDICLLGEQAVRPSPQNNLPRRQSETQYPYPERKQEIENFLDSLTEAKHQICENSNQVREILINSEEFYGSQIEEINEYFQTIMQSLELEKNKCYNHILLERQNAQKDARDTISRLLEGEREVESMIADIEENLDSVYSISWQNYKLVINAFQERMSEIERILHEIKVKGISDVQYRKIEFAGVPESINSLSEIIIQNSYGGSDATLLLTQNCSQLRTRNDNLPDHSIFDKLKTDYSCDSGAEGASNMVFSFDGDRMREDLKAEDHGGVRLRKNKFSMAGYGEDPVDRVEGIKEVQELDVLEVDEEGMDYPGVTR